MTGFHVRHNGYGRDVQHNYPRRSVTLMRKGYYGDASAATGGVATSSMGGVQHLGGGYHHSGAPYFVPGGLPVTKFQLADGSALYGDYGHMGAANAGQATANAAHTVGQIQLPRLPCTRDLESNPNPHPPRVTNQVVANQTTGYSAGGSRGGAGIGGIAYSQSYNPAPVHAAPPAAGGQAHYGGGAHYGGDAHYGGAGLNSHSARPNYGTGNQQDRIAYEVKPLPGVRYPRTSIGAGHPAGPLGEVVQVRYRGDNTDLSPLLPCTYAPNQYVNNPEDGDRYHRTSVYAASGLPIDMAAWASPGAWKERVQHQRP
jgi:hypothetical protein